MVSQTDRLAIERIAAQREYTIGSAMADLTGIGTLYSIGSDWAHKNRLDKMHAATKDIPLFNRIVKEYLSSANWSLLGKAAYLSSWVAVGAGCKAGIVGVAGLATAFLMRAGYNAASGNDLGQRLAHIKEKLV